MDDLIKLCRACSLDELAQAGGGNISVKDGSIMYIKSSGYSISDVKKDYGYVGVNTDSVLQSLQHDKEPCSIDEFIVYGKERPSLEMYFHSFLKKYVVHLHPTCMMGMLCSNNSELISYKRPGFELSKTIYESEYKHNSILYLKNHGIIIHSDEYNEMLTILQSIHEKHKKYWSTNLNEFWKIQNMYPNDYIYRVPYHESLIFLQHTDMLIRPITPDIVLFLTDSLVTTDDSIYIKAIHKAKCLSILEVLRSYCLSVDECKTELCQSETDDILDWNVEKYRKLK